jgi:hypothetical protein
MKTTELDELMTDLIREHGFTAVLDALAGACRFEADSHLARHDDQKEADRWEARAQAVENLDGAGVNHGR